MGLFNAIGVAGTGVTVYRKWMDAVSDNIANISTVRPAGEAPFQARYVIAQAVQASADGTPQGVQVGGAVYGGDPAGRMVYEPTHPLADPEGYVRYPDIDLGSQMTQLIMAQRGYQSNLAVVDRAREAYAAALQIGR